MRGRDGGAMGARCLDVRRTAGLAAMGAGDGGLIRLAPRSAAPYSLAMGSRRAAASLAEKLRAALDMADEGLALQRQNLRRRHPGASEAEIDRLFGEWLHDRPPDSPGRLIDWPRRRA